METTTYLEVRLCTESGDCGRHFATFLITGSTDRMYRMYFLILFIPVPRYGSTGTSTTVLRILYIVAIDRSSTVASTGTVQLYRTGTSTHLSSAGSEPKKKSGVVTVRLR